jgi:hypothetical protein
MGASKDSGACDSRAVYSPPCVVKINDLKLGAGKCDPSGSGDSEYCGTTGNSAAGLGCCTGNNASNGCWSGSSAGSPGCLTGSSGACVKDTGP